MMDSKAAWSRSSWPWSVDLLLLVFLLAAVPQRGRAADPVVPADPAVPADRTSTDQRPDPAASPILLRGVQLFDVHGGAMSGPQDILITDGIIREVRPSLPERDALEREAGGGQPQPLRPERSTLACDTIECTGKYAIPGLWDCHVHLSHLTLESEDSLRSALAGFVQRGVMQVRDVGGPIDRLSALSRRIAEGELLGPEIFYAGPMLESTPLTWENINQELPGFTVAIDSEADVDSLLPALAAQGACIIKTFNRIDKPLYRHVVEVARRCSLKIVHDAGMPLFHWMPMDEALELGVTSFEHAKSPWPIVLVDDLREKHDAITGPQGNPPGQMMCMSAAVEQGLGAISDERLLDLGRLMVEHEAFLCPTLYVFQEMSDAADSTKTEAQQAMMKKVLAAMNTLSNHFVRELSACGVRMLVGQDGCDPQATLAEMELMEQCGVSAAEVLRGATIYPAEWLEITDRLGSISPGRIANIVILNADPLADITHAGDIHLVLHQGELVDR
ncbi:MAG: amidohydrolase family protein [Candidatus Eisenbacteria bacterium]